MIFGLDLGTRRIAVACAEDQFRYVLSLEGARARREFPTAHDAGGEMGRLVRFEVAKVYGAHRDHLFFCEKPFPRTHGRAANPRSVVGQAISLGALSQWLPGTLEYEEPSVWKKELLGRGNAGKADHRAWIEAHRPALAEAAGQDQDLVDAFCIGVFAEQVVAARAVQEHQPVGLLRGQA